MNTNQINLNDVMLDPCVSFWAKDALRGLERRDPLDALSDAQLLVRIFEQRVRALFASHQKFTTEGQ